VLCDARKALGAPPAVLDKLGGDRASERLQP
jgi:hypothetical protein